MLKLLIVVGLGVTGYLVMKKLIAQGGAELESDES